MLAELKILQGADQGRSYALPKGQKLTIGRGTHNSISLNDTHVSRVHCQIEFDGDKVHVSDTGSGSGTWINGVRIDARQELTPGDLLVIGETQMSFQWTDADLRPTVGLESEDEK